MNVVLAATAEAGLVDLTLKDEAGRELAKARAVGKGGDATRLFVEGARSWRLEHAGAGQGYAYLDVTGLVKVGDAPDPPERDAPAWTWADVFRAYSTRPALPQTGQATSTGWPVAV